MLLQEPVQAAIWDALNHYAYPDATFLAERLYAEVSSDDALFLLATCYYRSGYPIQAYLLLQKKGCHTAQCRFLMARCCMELNKSSEAEDILSGSIVTRVKSLDEIESEFGNMACHVFSLLGTLYSKTERHQKATVCFKKSLHLNPLLWKSYERLCQMGEKIDPSEVFQVPVQMGLQSSQVQQQQQQPQLQQQQQLQHSTQTPQSVTDVLSPISEALTPMSNEVNMQLPAPQIVTMNTTPENQDIPMIDKLLTAAPKLCRTTRKLSKPCHALFLSPMTPSFGILPLETPSPASDHNLMPFITPSPLMFNDIQMNDAKAPKKKPSTRKGPNMNAMPKPPVFGINTNTRDVPKPLVGNIPNVRRSSRLFGNSNSSSVKENNKSPEKSRFASPKAVNRKSKPRISKSQQELNEINKSEMHVDSKPAAQPELPTPSQILQMQHQSLSGILNLLQQLGKAFMYLSQYECRKAIELFSDIPEHQYYTGWVLSHLGRSHFESADYKKAEKIFEELRRLEPYYITGMEMYSTTLWHLQREVELSVLAHELTDLDKQSPEAWCATGNCFSLQKEHDVAIKFFQRAIQVDPNFAYAYTLLGHEYVFTEELDKALACFRNAIRVDTRHYNAWYGVGLIYYKQEKFNFAEVHFRKALSINPNSSALLCHIGVVQHAQQKSESALSTLNRAIAADPRNALCKFHRASILFANDKHKDALQELEELKTIVPKESLVYFLIGKVHKKLGNTHLALMNFSWAMDLDPKGINNQIKEAIDKRYVTEEDDPLVHLNETAIEEGPSGEGDEETPQISLSDPDLQAIESDESL
ncbi:cell division cycle protein 27 homolog [Gigantopelta aegis]|uniref:cell division cycle protein 27 homolog n=1 Tax=Gigantopelta aegis TaxID=1735272 RepID=UPI001B88C8DC|nr:cell division cycle protein 27 homolog [Gigantopelta aegis]